MLGLLLFAQALALSPQEFYDQALARMARMPQPAVVTYDVTVHATGAQFYVSRDADQTAEFGFSVGSALGETVDSWHVVVNSSDGTTRVELGDDFAISRSPIMNATWSGVAAWMRYGPQSLVPQSTPSPAPVPSASGHEPATIETVRALGRSIYRVDYSGTGACQGGAPAQRFHLTPRDEDADHPATDVTVETATFFICRVRFELRPNTFIEPKGFIELYLEPYGNYPLVDESFIDFQTRRRFGNQHIQIAAVYRNVSLSQ